MNINPGDAVIWHGNTLARRLAARHSRRAHEPSRLLVASTCCQERRGDTRYSEVFERHANEPRFARLSEKKPSTGGVKKVARFHREQGQSSGLFLTNHESEVGDDG